ncbi:MAG: hypothetical protein RL748_66 [Pseudomonadota bacterium]
MTDFATTRSQTPRRRTRVFWALALLLASALLLALLMLWFGNRNQAGAGPGLESGDAGSANFNPANGQWVAAQKTSLAARIELNGVLAPADVVAVHAPFDGNLDQLQVQPGQTVQAGQPLFKVISLDMQARRNEAFAAVTRTRSALNELHNWNRSLQLTQARQAVERAKAGFERARKKREQVALLLDKGIAASGELIDADVELASSRDQLENAQAQYQQEVKKGSAPEVMVAERNHESAQALYDNLAARWQKSQVQAAKGGVLVKLPGAKALANGLKVAQDEALTAIWDGKSYLVRALVDQRDIKNVQVGQSASIAIDALGVTLPGKVSHLAYESSEVQGQPTTKYEVEIRLMASGSPTPAGAGAVASAGAPAMRLGMSAAISLQQAAMADAITVPLAAVRKRGQGANLETGVWVRAAGRQAGSWRVVSTGLTTSDAVQIISGLQAGEAVWMVLE